MAITDFFAPSPEYVSQMEDIQETYRVSTDNLTAIFTRSFVRVQIYKNESSQHGWNSRKMVYSSEGVPLEEFSTEFVKKEVSNVYKNFDQQEIDLLMKKAIVKLIQNEK